MRQRKTVNRQYQRGYGSQREDIGTVRQATAADDQPGDNPAKGAERPHDREGFLAVAQAIKCHVVAQGNGGHVAQHIAEDDP
ncbi:hypothetical protein D3C71_1812640 [compost metagenome]